MKRVRTEIDKVRANAGLKVPIEALSPPIPCPRCKRAYQWTKVPEECPWPMCGGILRQPE